jgi:tripartite-type tricarboxylate transporter receptor subunit TctC
MRRRSAVAVLAAGALSRPAPAVAEAQPAAWPGQAVRIVVPFPAGGAADSVPRIVAEALRPVWRQPIVIDNRPGAGGNIGAALVASAAPDGYTLLASPPPPIAINQHLYGALPFDPTKLRAVSVLASAPNVVEVSIRSGITSLDGLIRRARAEPGGLNAANQGLGTTSHLTAALFEQRAGVRFNHVPYSGTAPALNDLVAGHVDVFFDNIAFSLPNHLAGTIRILAVCAEERAPQLPDVPTTAEGGLGGVKATAWYAVMAPHGTREALAARIGADIVAAVRQPEVQRRLAAQACKPVGSAPAEAAAFIADETRLWGEVVRRTGLRLGGADGCGVSC